MVHKNYKWNISKEEGETIVFKVIREILEEKKDNSMNYQELLLLIQNRTNNIDITHNKKKKSLLNFIRVNYGSIEQLIDNTDEMITIEKKNGKYIKLTEMNYNINEWIIVQ
tara:strand:+ start:369 stop:701 length:333 start_codon:yes stop_codon:yes gene_type:complete